MTLAIVVACVLAVLASRRTPREAPLPVGLEASPDSVASTPDEGEALLTALAATSSEPSRSIAGATAGERDLSATEAIRLARGAEPEEGWTTLRVHTLEHYDGHGGVPVPNIAFELSFRPSEQDEPHLWRGRTDDEGRCLVEIDERFLTQHLRLSVLDGDHSPDPDDPASLLVRGRAVEPGFSRRSVEAQVYALGERRRFGFRFSNRKAEQPIEGYVRIEFDALEENVPLVLSVRRGASAFVMVEDERGLEVPAHVTALERKDEGWVEVRRVVRFERDWERAALRLDFDRDWTGALVATDEQGGRGALWNVELSLDGEPREWTIRLDGGAAFAGRVLDSSGEPVADLEIEVELSRREEAGFAGDHEPDEWPAIVVHGKPLGERRTNARTFTDENGAFRLTNLLPGRYFVFTHRVGIARGFETALTDDPLATGESEHTLIHDRPRLVARQRSHASQGGAANIGARASRDAWPRFSPRALRAVDAWPHEARFIVLRYDDREADDIDLIEARHGANDADWIHELVPGQSYLVGLFGGGAPPRFERIRAGERGTIAREVNPIDSRAMASLRLATNVPLELGEESTVLVELRSPEHGLALCRTMAKSGGIEWRLPAGRYFVVARALEWPRGGDRLALGRGEAHVELATGEERALQLNLSPGSRLRVTTGPLPERFEAADGTLFPGLDPDAGARESIIHRSLWLSLERADGSSIELHRAGRQGSSALSRWRFGTSDYSAPTPSGNFVLVARHVSGWTRRLPVALPAGQTIDVHVDIGASR